jgi:hypothetical protein
MCETILETSPWPDDTGTRLSQKALSFQNLPRRTVIGLFEPHGRSDAVPVVIELIHLLCALYQLPVPSAWLLDVSRILYKFALAHPPGFTFLYYGEPGGPPGDCHLHMLEYFQTYLADPYGAVDSVPVQEMILHIFHRTHTLTFSWVVEFADTLTDELLYHAYGLLALIWWDDPLNVALRIGGSIARTVYQTLQGAAIPETGRPIEFPLLKRLFEINFRADSPSAEFWELLTAFATPHKGPECFLMRGVLASLLPYQSLLFFLISEDLECQRHVSRICNLLMIEHLSEAYPGEIDFAKIFHDNGVLIELAALIPNLSFLDARITINTIVTYLPELADESLLELLSTGFLENLADFRCPGANRLRLRALSIILQLMVNMHDEALIVYGGQIVIHKLLPWHFEGTDLEEEEDDDDDEGEHEGIHVEDRDQGASVVIDAVIPEPELPQEFKHKFDHELVLSNWPCIRDRLCIICGEDMCGCSDNTLVDRLTWMTKNILASEAEEKTRAREQKAFKIWLGRQDDIYRIDHEPAARVNAAFDGLCGGPH